MKPPFLIACCALALFWPDVAAAQNIRRCTAADGSVVMTDKPCAAIGAAERVPRQAGMIANQRPHRGGCARDLEALSFEVAAAIDLQDANRLAGVYHWLGLDARRGYEIMQRLENLVKLPLVDIGPSGGGSEGEAQSVDNASGEQGPVAPKRRAANGLRIVQNSGRDGQTRATVFGLRRHLGCLWLSL